MITKFLNTAILFCLLFLLTNCHESKTSGKYDVVIYGATSGGIAAAIQAKRMGKSVILIEPGSRIGGLTTGGLGQTVIGNKAAIGGISREFYEAIKRHYDDPVNWKWQEKEEYIDGGQTRTREGENSMLTFETSAALKVYEDFIQNEHVELVQNKKLDRKTGVVMDAGKIVSIKMLSGDVYYGKMFIELMRETSWQRLGLAMP